MDNLKFIILLLIIQLLVLTIAKQADASEKSNKKIYSQQNLYDYFKIENKAIMVAYIRQCMEDQDLLEQEERELCRGRYHIFINSKKEIFKKLIENKE